MAIIPLSRDYFDNATIELHPKRKFSSSSLPAGTGSISGSVYVFAENSKFNKETLEIASFDESAVNAASLDDYRQSVFASSSVTSDMYTAMEDYLLQVTNTAPSRTLQKQVEILRFEPTNTFTSDTLRKLVVIDTLFNFYRGWYPNINYAYTNYHCLNFFTGAMVPTSSCLVYPAPNLGNSTNQYNPTTGFTFAFNVNPRRTTKNVGDEYRPGGIMHMSSAYAISLITGSNIADNGLPDEFRIMLQLSHSADIAPSQVNISAVDAGTNTFPQDLIYITPDGLLKLNNWHHVAAAWTATHNAGTGSFYIDAIKRNSFLIPSAAINTTDQVFNPLIIGNFFDAADSKNNTMGNFFNAGAASTEGVEKHSDTNLNPSQGVLSHPLNAEIHNLRIYDDYQSDATLYSASFHGVSDTTGLMFYLPPFFTKGTPNREVLITPFQTTNRPTDLPFNAELSFGVDGRNINLENFCRDFANKLYPRCFFLTASTINESTQEYTANQFLWESASFAPSVRARNLLMFPCDDGKFNPDWELLRSGTAVDILSTPPPQFLPVSGSETDRYINDKKTLDLSLINLRDLIPESTEFSMLPGDSGTGILQEILGSSPESPSTGPGAGWTIYERTLDNTSNEVVFFDASNLFYGMKILPGSVKLVDSSVTGSGGELSLIIRDDGRGNLYRANSANNNASWNSVGNVLYEEGIMLIKSPNIPYFGREQYEISFEGVQNIHTLEINVPASKGKVNSSSNVSYTDGMIPDSYASTTDNDFVSISGVLLHDDNLNIISRTTLSQPIVKKQTDKYLFRIKIDF